MFERPLSSRKGERHKSGLFIDERGPRDFTQLGAGMCCGLIEDLMNHLETRITIVTHLLRTQLEVEVRATFGWIGGRLFHPNTIFFKDFG